MLIPNYRIYVQTIIKTNVKLNPKNSKKKDLHIYPSTISLLQLQFSYSLKET
jgi:hypothetical protein